MRTNLSAFCSTTVDEMLSGTWSWVILNKLVSTAGQVFLSHFTDEETVAQRGYETAPSQLFTGGARIWMQLVDPRASAFSILFHKNGAQQSYSLKAILVVFRFHAVRTLCKTHLLKKLHYAVFMQVWQTAVRQSSFLASYLRLTKPYIFLMEKCLHR